MGSPVDVVPASGVEVRFRRGAGTRVCGLDRLSVDEVLAAGPVREFRWYRGRRFYSSWYWSATTGGLVPYESRLELARIMLADFDLEVVGIAAGTATVGDPTRPAAHPRGDHRRSAARRHDTHRHPVAAAHPTSAGQTHPAPGDPGRRVRIDALLRQTDVVGRLDPRPRRPPQPGGHHHHRIRRPATLLVPPRQRPTQVLQMNAWDGTEEFTDAVKLADQLLDLRHRRTLRMLAVVSDGQYVDIPAAQKLITTLHRTGCAVLWLQPADLPSHTFTDTTTITVADPLDAIEHIANAAITALANA
jgi:hypothetical protein